MGPQRHSPRDSSPTPKSRNLKFLLDLDSWFNSVSIRQPRHAEILSLIASCSTNFTFTNPSKSPSQQNLKRNRLNNLLSIIKPGTNPLPDQILSPLFAMISANLFRPLPPPTARVVSNSSSRTVLLDDDDEMLTAAWPHLSIVYDILLRLIVNLQTDTLRAYLDNSFITNLLSLFQSEDPRERDSLRTVCHRIYAKLHYLRSFIRKAMNDIFLDYIFNAEADQHPCGIGDLLEIWGTIANGFSVPLKEEHKLFLIRVLIPLHRPKCIEAYHKQLAYCIYQFVEKEPVLGVAVVRGILKYWPVANCPKEVLLIREVEELVGKMGVEQHRILALPLCKQITKCLNSSNLQVAERAHYAWNNEQFVKMASEALEDVFPVLVRGMEKNLKEHWSSGVRELTQNVKEMLEGMEPVLYSKCLSEIDCVESAKYEEEKRRRQRWERVEMEAKFNQLIGESSYSYISKYRAQLIRH